MTGRVARAVPASGWLRAYDRAWLRADLVAGVSAGAVVVPQAMAYATVAGLPVQVGLMTCIVPVVVYALLGGSRRLSLSTTSTIMTLAAAAIVGLGGSAGRDPVGTTATLTLLVGVILVLARLLRLGFLVESVSELVLFGLKIAVGLTIAVGQLPKLLGLTRRPARGSSAASATSSTISVTSARPRWPCPPGPWPSWSCCAGSVRGCRGPSVALALGIGLVVLAGIDLHGVRLIAPVPRGLVAPSLPSLDDVGRSRRTPPPSR